MIDDRIFQVCEQISKNLVYNRTLEEMIKAIGLSKSHFIKLLKTSKEMPLPACFRDMRLKKLRMATHCRTSLNLPDSYRVFRYSGTACPPLEAYDELKSKK